MFLYMKKYLIIILSILFLTLFASVCYYIYTLNTLEEEYNRVVCNEKALLYDVEMEQNNIRALTLTIEELELAKDSVLAELNNVRKQLKIKDNEVKSLQNIKTESIKTDTLILRDTIFKQESFKLDTLLGDKWHSLNLNLEYPNKIGYTTSFNEDLNVVAYTNKETVSPPKKCWISRIFQKKHIVTRVEVTSNNPYSNIKDQTFVIIE